MGRMRRRAPQPRHRLFVAPLPQAERAQPKRALPLQWQTRDRPRRTYAEDSTVTTIARGGADHRAAKSTTGAARGLTAMRAEGCTRALKRLYSGLSGAQLQRAAVERLRLARRALLQPQRGIMQCDRTDALVGRGAW